MNTSENEIRRLPELDIMKVFGIFLVVLGHVTRMYTPNGLIQPIEHDSFMHMLTKVIYSFHMPLFVFVSGMTFAYVSARKTSYQRFFSFVANKAKRLMIPYFAFACFWVLPFMVGFGFRSFGSYLFDGIILSLDSRHLWYVWMLFNVFILFYGMRLLVDKMKLSHWTLLLISGILFCAESIWGGRFPYFQIDNALYYQFWFTLGYIAIVYKRQFRMLMPIVLVLGFITSLRLRFIVNVLYAMFGIFLFYYLAPYCKNIANNALFKAVNRNSFGIYLFHPIIIYAVIYYFKDTQLNHITIFCITLFCSFFLSLFLTELMRKLHLQIIIGEKQKI